LPAFKREKVTLEISEHRERKSEVSKCPFAGLNVDSLTKYKNNIEQISDILTRKKT
jgi:hypothetical protein